MHVWYVSLSCQELVKNRLLLLIARIPDAVDLGRDLKLHFQKVSRIMLMLTAKG